jgi:hypothetical protein
MRYDAAHIHKIKLNGAKGYEEARRISKQAGPKLKRAQTISMKYRKGITVTLARTA